MLLPPLAPRPAPQIMPPLAPQLAVQEVRTFDELLSALGRLRRRGATVACWGQAISIVADLQVRSSVDLSHAAFSGLTIFSPSRAVLIPTAAMDDGVLFIAEAVIAGLRIQSLKVSTGTNSEAFGTVIRAGGLLSPTFSEVDWQANDLFLDGTSTINDLSMIGIIRAAGLGEMLDAQVFRSGYITGCKGGALSFQDTSENVAIVGNRQIGNVTVIANSDGFTIVGNAGTGTIDTSASDGSNVIACNSKVDSIASHATDAVGLNT